jgi:hypothetical protein
VAGDGVGDSGVAKARLIISAVRSRKRLGASFWIAATNFPAHNDIIQASAKHFLMIPINELRLLAIIESCQRNESVADIL